MSERHLRVLVEVDHEVVVDFDEDVISMNASLDTPVMDVSPEGPYKRYEHSGDWHLSVKALRKASHE